MSEKDVCKNMARDCAAFLSDMLGNNPVPRTALILGTGWGDAVEFDDSIEVPFQELPGFKDLPSLDGHARRVVYGKLGGIPVLALRGRVHLNESYAEDMFYRYARVQAQMLLELGVEKLVLTCAAGSLGDRAEVGDIVVINGLFTLFAPKMAMFGAEFKSPEDTLTAGFLRKACEAGADLLSMQIGGYVMLRGPFFEGRKYDKPFLATTGCSVVGMSVLPEACIAALYDAEAVALAFVTNDDKEVHSHDENKKRVKESADKLGEFLTRLVRLTENS